MFKKDEYIVTLKLQNYTDDCAKENYCFKVKRDEEYLTMYKDLRGYKNGHSILTFDKSKKLVDWRYATTEEAKHYELIDKPYDVTTLPKFVLPDNWHILVTEENAIDVLTWRFEKSYNITYNTRFLDYNEITYDQFKKYVLNQNVEKEDLSYLVKFLNKINMT